MSAIKRFWRYWRENFEATKGGFDIAALFVTVMLATGCVLKTAGCPVEAPVFVGDVGP